jgi:hypothetical protein
MGKIGFLAMPDLLVYGLAGWSWGGFEVDQTLPYTLSGFTYGGGIERDFGWLRGFIQVKTINYREKSIMETLRTANDRAENSWTAYSAAESSFVDKILKHQRLTVTKPPWLAMAGCATVQAPSKTPTRAQPIPLLLVQLAPPSADVQTTTDSKAAC